MVFNTAENRMFNKLWRWLNNTPKILRSLVIIIVYIVVGVALEELADLYRVTWTVQPWDPAAGWHIFLLFAFGLRYAPAIIFVPLIEDIVFTAPNDSVAQGIVAAVLATIVYTIACDLALHKFNIEPRLFRLQDVVKLMLLNLRHYFLLLPYFMVLLIWVLCLL